MEIRKICHEALSKLVIDTAISSRPSVRPTIQIMILESGPSSLGVALNTMDKISLFFFFFFSLFLMQESKETLALVLLLLETLLNFT